MAVLPVFPSGTTASAVLPVGHQAVLPATFDPVVPVAQEILGLSLGRGRERWQFLLPQLDPQAVSCDQCLLFLSGCRLGSAGSELPAQIGSNQVAPLLDLLRWTVVLAPIPSCASRILQFPKRLWA